MMKYWLAVQLLTTSFVGDVGLTELGTSLLLVGITNTTRPEDLMVVWTAVRKWWLVFGVRTVGDVDMFTNEPTVVIEDVSSRILPISDIWSTEVGRLVVPDSKRAELVWETISFGVDTGSSVWWVLASECVVCTLVEILCRNGVLTYVVLSFCRAGSFLGNELVVRVFPFTSLRVLEEAKPVRSVLI